MMVSTRGRYALRIMADLAQHNAQDYIPLKALAGRQEISEKYLESILKSLVTNKLLTGVRGPGGGYRLTKDPEDYTAGEILRASEGDLAPVACLEKGAPPCPRASFCSTLDMWRGLYDTVNAYLDGVTLADLAKNGSGGDDYVI